VSESDTGDATALELVVDASAAGTRLDTFLAATIGSLSRTRAHRAIEAGDVLVDGTTAKPSLKLSGGERVEIDLTEPPPTQLVAEAIPIAVVYEDEHLVVVDKPAGLVVHPGAGVPSGTLANGLLYKYGGSGGGPAWRPGIVHRIDRDTSGLLVVARTEAAHAALAAQFAARTVTKRYVALVYGRLGDDEGRLDKPIARHPKIRVRMAVATPGRGRPALTLYRAVERFDQATLVDVEIRTGRTHQIRVHFADIAHPVVGDEVYGSGREGSIRDAALRRRIASLGRQFLHAAFLAFDHPATGARVELSSRLPPELAELLEYFRERAR
jgi:23S rRNA pseudouridine1911/1915/1917 synthase